MQFAVPHDRAIAAERNANIPAERGANIPADPPGELVLPLIRPYFGGAVVGRVADNILRVSYSGRQPYGDRELGELFAAPGTAWGIFEWVRQSGAVQ